MKITAMARRLLSLILAAVLCISLLPEMHAKAATVISTASVTIEEPVVDDDPDYDPVFPSGAHYYSNSYSNKYFYNDVCWCDITTGSAVTLEVDSAYFERGHKYKAVIYLTAYSGYEFADTTTCTVNGKTVTCMKTSAGQLRAEIEFPALKETIYYVNLTITPPKAGEAPDYYPDYTAGYGYYSADYDDDDAFLNDVYWSDLTDECSMIAGADSFRDAHAYKVYIYLTADENYVFSDSVYCRVNGKVIDTRRVTLSGQLCIEIEFPPLNVYLGSVRIEITPPAIGEYPDYFPNLPDAQFYHLTDETSSTCKNGVTWVDKETGNKLKVDEDVFEAGHIYGVEISLTANENCWFHSNWTVHINDDVYYGSASDDVFSEQISVHWYFDPLLSEGWQKIDGYWYYTVNGEMATGWKKIGGKWYYFSEYGKMTTGWEFIKYNGSYKLFYFNDSGVMQTGWQKIGDYWFYFNDSGVTQTGWKKIDGKWYYFALVSYYDIEKGAMMTGWQEIDDKWYYFSSSGAMQTGWKQIGSKWYYFNSSGVMQTGWQTIKDKTYYFKTNGAMAAKEWCKGYWLNADGTWTYKYKASWKQNSKGWWYGDTSGWYAKNCTITIDGKSYTFDANGYMK